MPVDASVVDRREALRIADEELGPVEREILKALYRYRLMSTAQVGRLFFPGSASEMGRVRAARRHMARIEAAGLAASRPPARDRQKLYRLSEAGMHVAVAFEGKRSIAELKRVCSEKLASSFLRNHHLEVVDVAVAFESARGGELLEWGGDWDMLYRYINLGTRYRLRPDARGVWASNGDIFPFFVEVDRGKRTTGDVEAQVEKYAAFFASGAYVETEGCGTFPPVLFVVPTETRRKSLARKVVSGTYRAGLGPEEAARKVPVALALREALAAESPFGAIWELPLRGESGKTFYEVSAAVEEEKTN